MIYLSAEDEFLTRINKPKSDDEVEAALAIQMACTHCAAMVVLARLGTRPWERESE
jgi:hypothetical protein